MGFPGVVVLYMLLHVKNGQYVGQRNPEEREEVENHRTKRPGGCELDQPRALRVATIHSNDIR